MSMNYKETIRRIKSEQHLTQKTLAKKTGYKSATAINRLLNRDRNNITINNLLQILNGAGYELIVQERDNKRNKWELTPVENSEEDDLE